MGQRLAIIGASYLQEPLVRKAKDMGIYTICFAWREGAVCATMADKYYPISIIEKDEILAICRQEQINGICTIASDVAAPTVAYVANSMQLAGNNYTASLRANNKGMMRDAFKQAGIQCPWYKKVSIFEEIQESELKFPLIVKPVDRSGSRGVTKVENLEELTRAIQVAITESFSKEAIVEHCVDGREISVEFISFKGKHYPLTITDKVTTEAPHFVELEHHEPSTLPKLIQQRIFEITKQALQALNITDGASHTEYKITNNGEINIIELGARMGGDFIGSDLVPLSLGYDFVKGVIEVALNQFTPPLFKEPACSGVYFLCKDTERVLPYIQNSTKYPQIVRAELTNPLLHTVTCSAERSGYLIYKDNKKFKI